MKSIDKPRIVMCVLAIMFAAILGCQDSAPTDPATDDSTDAEKTDQPAPAETVTPEPPVEETAEPARLGIGSPAPPLSIAQWVTGEPIEGFDPGQVYVVEFWATWCGPCLMSMPHLSQLQSQYGDEVKCVGVTSEPEAEEKVKTFLESEQSPGKTWAEVITYRLAIDSDGATNQAYMEAAQQPGIPAAFIVGRDGVVEWIGHPMAMDEPLAQVVAGDWDRQAAIERFRRQQEVARITREVINKFRAEDWDAALDLLDQLEKEPLDDDLQQLLQVKRMRLFVLQNAGRGEEAAQLQAEIVEQAWDSPMLLNEIAWGIAMGDGVRDLDLALKAAQRASELQEHGDPSTLDTLARIYYEKGELDQAIEWQKKAVEQSQGDPSLQATLKKYEDEKASPPGAAAPPPEGGPAGVEQ